MLNGYIKLFAEIYQNELFNIVDIDTNFSFLSSALKKLLNVTGIEDMERQGNVNFDLTRKANKQVLNNGRTQILFSVGKLNDQVHAFKISKYPIYNSKSEKVIGVFSLIRNAVVIDWDEAAGPQVESLCFKIDGEECLSSIDELILFYGSIGYTQGDIYNLIIKQGQRNLSLNGFKYYYNRLLDKTRSAALSDIINNNNFLKKRRFVPRELIKARALVI